MIREGSKFAKLVFWMTVIPRRSIFLSLMGVWLHFPRKKMLLPGLHCMGIKETVSWLSRINCHLHSHNLLPVCSGNKGAVGGGDESVPHTTHAYHEQLSSPVDQGRDIYDLSANGVKGHLRNQIQHPIDQFLWETPRDLWQFTSWFEPQMSRMPFWWRAYDTWVVNGLIPWRALKRWNARSSLLCKWVLLIINCIFGFDYANE